jgi:hypothetical protein
MADLALVRLFGFTSAVGYYAPWETYYNLGAHLSHRKYDLELKKPDC